MRTYAADTALPGGKYEEGDTDEEGTAVNLFWFTWQFVLILIEKGVL